MINLALTQPSRIAVLATFERTIISIMAEFKQAAERSSRAPEVMPYFIPGVMQALREGARKVTIAPSHKWPLRSTPAT